MTDLAEQVQSFLTDDVSPLAGTNHPIAKLSEPVIAHREEFRAYVLAEAEPWHREHLGRLYALWEEWNQAYYEGAMVAPYILLNEPSAPRVYGDCGPVSGFGGQSQIRIRPSLLTGTHPHVRESAAFAAGRFAFAADVLVHEMVHQWQQEVSDDRDDAYHGHGPVFRDRANAIGAALGLPPVRTCKKRGQDAALPSCSQWPHNVRPGDFYGGAYVPPVVCRRRETLTVPTDPAGLLAALTQLLSPADARQLARGLEAHFGPTQLVPASGDVPLEDAS